MKYPLKPQEQIKIGTINSYKFGELKLKTKDQINRIININNNKIGRSQIKTEDLILRLDKDEFLNFLEKESEKQVFTNKKIEYYESLLKRLEELRSFIDKNNFKKYKKIIEEGFEKFCKNKNIDYLDYIIENNPKYKKAFDLIKKGNFFINFTKTNNNEEYFLILKDNNDILNFKIEDLQKEGNEKYLKILYENQNESNKDYEEEKKDKNIIVLFKIKKQKLFNLLKNDIDFKKYLKGNIRGKGAYEKINEIYNESDYEMIELLIIKNLVHKNNDLKNFEKILKKLNIENGKNNKNFNKKLITAVKFKINKLKEEKNEKEGFEGIKNLFNTNPKDAKDILLKWLKTKKGQEKFENFIKYITENRGRGGTKKYTNKNFLEKIIEEIEKNTNNSKNTQKLLQILKEKLEHINNLINKK